MSIHRLVIRRLALGWFLTSLLLATIVFWRESEQIDDGVSDMAVQAAQQFTQADLALLNQAHHQPAHLQALADIVTQRLERQFVVVEVYDREERKILEQVRDGGERVEAVLKGSAHVFQREPEPRYEKHLVNGQMILQVMTPLLSPSREVEGYLEGVYVVDEVVQQRLHRQVWRVLATVLVAILALTAALYPIITRLHGQLLKASRSLLEGNLELLEVLGSAIAKRDSDTNIHNYRVTLYSLALAEAAGMPKAEIRDLIAGAFLHDVGKIGISDSILLKPAKLTEEEFATMRTHVTLGIEILQSSTWLMKAREVVEFHHEKYDGSGYMRGLRGEEIPLAARIFAIADVFDALTSRRPYKEPMPYDKAMGILQKDAGTHFDPVLIAVFAQISRGLYDQLFTLPDEQVVALMKERVEGYYFA